MFHFDSINFDATHQKLGPWAHTKLQGRLRVPLRWCRSVSVSSHISLRTSMRNSKPQIHVARDERLRQKLNIYRRFKGSCTMTIWTVGGNHWKRRQFVTSQKTWISINTLWQPQIWTLRSNSAGWIVRRSNPFRDEIFVIRPDRSWSPSSFLYNGCTGSFPGVRRPGRGVDHPPHLSPRLKKE